MITGTITRKIINFPDPDNRIADWGNSEKPAILQETHKKRLDGTEEHLSFVGNISSFARQDDSNQMAVWDMGNGLLRRCKKITFLSA